MTVGKVTYVITTTGDPIEVEPTNPNYKPNDYDPDSWIKRDSVPWPEAFHYWMQSKVIRIILTDAMAVPIRWSEVIGVTVKEEF